MNGTQKTLFALAIGSAVLLFFLLGQGPEEIVELEKEVTGSTPESIVLAETKGGDRLEVAPYSSRAIRFQLVSSQSGAVLESGKLIGDRARPFVANDDGEIAVALAEVGEHILVAECPGYSSKEVQASLAEAEVVNRIELVPNSRIHGRVLDLAGKPSPQGVVVIGFQGAVPSAEAFLDIKPGVEEHDPRYLCTVTDSFGEFEIENLDPSFSFTLVAGGAGLISPNSVTNVAPEIEGGEGVDIQVAHTWGVQINVIHNDGMALRGDGRLFQGLRGVASQIQGAHGAHPLPNLPWLTLLGIHPNELNHELPSVKTFRALLFGPPHSYGNPMLTYFWSCPGYKDEEITEELEPLVDGIKKSSLFVTQESDGFGSIEVEIKGSVLDESSGGRLSSPDLLVELYPMDEPRRTRDVLYRYAIVSAADGTHTIDGVPNGNYSVGFKSRSKLWSLRPEHNSLRVSGDTSIVTLNLDGLGLARIEVLDELGFSLPLKVRTRFHRWDPTEGGHHAFEYSLPSKRTISMLPPGDYRFYPERPFPPGFEPVDSEGVVVTIRANETSEVNLPFKALVD